LVFTANSSPGPGNFGFLRTAGQGASVLANALATNSPGVCYAQEGLDSEPGGNVGPVEQGLNTRFGIYGGSFGNNDDDWNYRPDKNVRKGQSFSNSGNPECASYDPEDDPLDAMALPAGDVMEDIGSGGGQISQDDDWDLDTYWDISHGTHLIPPADDPNYNAPSVNSTIRNLRTTYPPGGTVTVDHPSRYDVYNYERDYDSIGAANGSGYSDLTLDAAPNGETGEPLCHDESSGSSNYPISIADDTSERRVIFSAVVNCLEHEDLIQGAATDIPAEAFVRMFLTKPVITDGNDRYISMEVIDITGKGGLGTIEEFLREEAELVR
jgi:hypothetical protein